MARLVRLQPAARIDNITDDGHVGYQLPYPFYVAEDGSIQNQEFWQGTATAVIGFQKDLARQTIDLFWREAVLNPELTLGMYLVTTDRHGTWGTHGTAIEGASTFEESDK